MRVNADDARIGIVGLGYVGLPLATEFGKQLSTIGYDIDAERVAQLRAGRDVTLEVPAADLAAARFLRFTASASDLSDCNVYIVTVPTPIDRGRQPDLTFVTRATETIGALLKRGDVVVYESTVYPGVTEDVCVPILERVSGLAFNRDFFAGYSPERINPGDKTHRLPDIVKVTAGSTPEAGAFVDALYRRIVRAGTHPAPSIRVAEAAKVIENTQRDVNIALVNELAILFNRLGLNTQDVLDAARTKWNFLPFSPGLVGGHCIGVDPYYLTHKAQEVGHHPEMILAGRRINDGMGGYVAERVVGLMLRRRLHVVDSRVLVLGFTFKEECPDVRNTRVIDIVRKLETFHARVDVFDPWADRNEVEREYGVAILENPPPGQYDAAVVAVAHMDFRERGINWVRSLLRPDGVVFDVKYLFPADQVEDRL